ncbi:hypothetical protein PybrP1_012809 [[Pythium] brassicae (nom. inval.)]|nr:hypothetical protein PybrP1_012809 [[Pythium] brassicae (nom. inval.)]
MALREQQLYIRVLEEAVHLKAFELRVAGHEELLMVLAELRHTVCQQEQDVADRQRHIETLQRQLCEQNEKHVALEQQLDDKSTKRELEIHELRQERAVLAAQLAQTQRQCERECEQRARLQATAADDSERLARLSEQLSSAAQLKTLADAKCAKLTRSLAEAEASVARVTDKCEHETEAARRLREDFARRAAQLEEAKTLQDELLRSIDSYANKAESAARESEQLRHQLQTVQSASRSSLEVLERAEAELKRHAEHLQTSLEAAQSQLSETREALETARQRVAALETQLHAERSQAASAIEELAAELETRQRTAEKSEQQRREMRESWRELNAALAAAVGLMRQGSRRCSSLCGGADESDSSDEAETLEQLTAVTQHEMLRSSWQRERSDLRSACDELHATARVCHAEMQQVHQEHVAAHEQLAEVSRELSVSRQETARLQHANEELARAVEQHHVLEQQTREQQRLIDTQTSQLDVLARSLQSSEACEQLHRAALGDELERVRTLSDERDELRERAQQHALVEHAFESAVELAERQNVENRRLAEKLATLKRLNTEQDESLETLRREAQRGDVARLVQLFPALLEDIVAAETRALAPSGKAQEQLELIHEAFEAFRR